MTNTTKAHIIALVNAILALVATFHVALTQAQLGAGGVAINAALALYVALTYKSSPKRIPGP